MNDVTCTPTYRHTYRRFLQLSGAQLLILRNNINETLNNFPQVIRVLTHTVASVLLTIIMVNSVVQFGVMIVFILPNPIDNSTSNQQFGIGDLFDIANTACQGIHVLQCALLMHALYQFMRNKTTERLNSLVKKCLANFSLYPKSSCF